MDRQKKIIIALSANLLSDQRMQRISAALCEQGWDVSVYYRSYFKYGQGRKPEMPYIKDIHFFALHTLFKRGIAFYLNYNLLLFYKLFLRKTNVLYAVDSDTVPALGLLSILKRKPLVYDAHEYFAEVPELQGKTIKKRIWHAVAAFACKRARVCITVSESLAEALQVRYGKAFACIRNVPVAAPSASTMPAEGKPIVLYQGALNRGRQLETLIRAMRKLPDFRCILAGEGDLSTTLRQEAAGADNIEFAGLLSPAELRALTPACFAGYNLLDAKDSLSYYYSLSNKYFDYMQAGIPSISSPLPEYIKLNERWHCGVCIGNSEDELISILRHWKNQPEVYLKLKENAKFAAETEHWDKEKLVLHRLLDF